MVYHRHVYGNDETKKIFKVFEDYNLTYLLVVFTINAVSLLYGGVLRSIEN